MQTGQAAAKKSAFSDDDFHKWLPYAHSIAASVGSRLPIHVDLDDLKSVAVLGLLDALSKRDVTMADGQFKVYLGFRIKGQIVDYLRGVDDLSRNMRRKLKEQEEQERQTLQLANSTDENNPGLPNNESAAPKKSVQKIQVVSLSRYSEQPNGSVIDEISIPDSALNQEQMLIQKQNREVIWGLVEQLPERHAQIVRLYVLEDMTFADIGFMLGINESRTSQLFTQIREKLILKLFQSGITSA